MSEKKSAMPLPKNLQRVFENAVRDIYQCSVKGQVPIYRRPIAQRAGSNPNHPDAVAEKRALADAAKALAQLWRISPNSSR